MDGEFALQNGAEYLQRNAAVRKVLSGFGGDLGAQRLLKRGNGGAEAAESDAGGQLQQMAQRHTCAPGHIRPLLDGAGDRLVEVEQPVERGFNRKRSPKTLGSAVERMRRLGAILGREFVTTCREERAAAMAVVVLTRAFGYERETGYTSHVSRAFVKEDESGGEAIVPRAVRQHPYYVTPEGFAALQADLQRAQRSGDERALEALRERIDAATVMHPRDGRTDIVQFGATVTVEEPHGATREYRIVGEDEANPPGGTISWLSPLAQALLDRHCGDRVIWERPAGNIALRVIKIRYA